MAGREDDIELAPEGGGAPEGVPLPGEAPVVDPPLTADEEAEIGREGALYGRILIYLMGVEGNAFSPTQKDAFFNLALGVGLTDAIARFHPTVMDPTTAIDLADLPPEMLLFSNVIKAMKEEADTQADLLAQTQASLRDATARVVAFAATPTIIPATPLSPLVSINPSPSTRRRSGVISGSGFGPSLVSSTFMGPPSGPPFLPPSSLPPDPSTSILPVAAVPPFWEDRMGALEEAVMSFRGMNRSSFIPHDGVELIACPIMGSNTNMTKCMKSIRSFLGSEKFGTEDVGKGSHSPLKNILPVIKRLIEQEKLDGPSAFLCLMAVLKGDLHHVVSNQMNEKKDFCDAWKHIQLLSHGSYSRQGIKKEIKKLVSTHPEVISATLARLQILYKQLYQHIADPVRRNSSISSGLIEKVWQIISDFFPQAFG